MLTGATAGAACASYPPALLHLPLVMGSDPILYEMTPYSAAKA